MRSSFPSAAVISRAELPSRTLAVLHRGGARNPDVLLVQTAGGPVVVKDFAPRSVLVRLLLGRWLTSRELRVYRRLDGLAAVPRALGRIDALAFAVEYRPGRRMSRRLAGGLPGFIDRLSKSVRAMHARGVFHLDLRHRSNVLVDARGEPVLIDFASALMVPQGGRLAAIATRVLARFDEAAIEKWRQRVEPGTATGGSTDSSGARRGASRPT